MPESPLSQMSDVGHSPVGRSAARRVAADTLLPHRVYRAARPQCPHLGQQTSPAHLLFRTVSQTLLQFGQQNLGGQRGATLVLHTWDQTLNAHFHLHCLVPAGALAEDGPTGCPPIRASSSLCGP